MIYQPSTLFVPLVLAAVGTAVDLPSDWSPPYVLRAISNDPTLNNTVASLSWSSLIFNSSVPQSSAWLFYPSTPVSVLYSQPYATTSNTSCLRLYGTKRSGEDMPRELNTAVQIMPSTNSITAWPANAVIWYGGFEFAADAEKEGRFLLGHQWKVEGWNWRAEKWSGVWSWSLWNSSAMSANDLQNHPAFEIEVLPFSALAGLQM